MSRHTTINRALAGSKTLIVLPVAISLCVLAVTAHEWFGHSKALGNQPLREAKSETATQAGQPSSGRTVVMARLQPQVRDLYRAIGSRLQQTGIERMYITGSIQREGEAAAPAQLVMEFPLSLRLDSQQANQHQSLGFDGHAAWKSAGSLADSDLALEETLLFDSADHFFWLQGQGATCRLLGTRFKDSDPGGSSYDIYQVSDAVDLGAGPSQRRKFYYFNSDNHLLERITYQIERAGVSAKAEIELKDWHQISGQQVPTTITRRENGTVTFAFTINTTTFVPALADGLFARPQDR